MPRLSRTLCLLLQCLLFLWKLLKLLSTQEICLLLLSVLGNFTDTPLEALLLQCDDLMIQMSRAREAQPLLRGW